MCFPHRFILTFVTSILLAVSSPVAGQIFDEPSNLQVLPKNTDATTLRNTMKSIAMGTGLRCSSCHVGEEGQNLTEYDFASDDKALKKKARVMLKMVNEINQTHLAQYGEDRVKVQCITCHRGVSKPRQIGEELALAASEGGPQGLKTRYVELKEKYYGSHSYDFREFTISEVARSRAQAGRMDEATVLLDTMLEENPQSISGHFIYGEVKRNSGDLQAALAHFKKALEIRPESVSINRRISEIEKELAGKSE